MTSVPSGAPYVSQRGPAKDCVIASLATAISLPYETIANALGGQLDAYGRPDLPNDYDILDTIYPLLSLGWSGAAIVTKEGFAQSQVGRTGPTSDELKKHLSGKLATIGYNDSDPAVGFHDLAWTGTLAIDCTTGEEIDLGTITILNAIVLTPLAK